MTEVWPAASLADLFDDVRGEQAKNANALYEEDFFS